MSLDYNLTDVVKPDDFLMPHPEFPGMEAMHWKYEVLIMPGTMLVGIGSLTDKTIPEFFARISCYERLHGALCRNGDGSPAYVQFEHVLAMKGLRTNVFPMETRTKWINRIVKDNYLNSIVFDKTREISQLRVAT